MNKAPIQFIDLFKDFAKFPEYAPKSAADLPDFIVLCRKNGKHQLAEYLNIWLEYLEDQMISEVTIYE